MKVHGERCVCVSIGGSVLVSLFVRDELTHFVRHSCHRCLCSH